MTASPQSASPTAHPGCPRCRELEELLDAIRCGSVDAVLGKDGLMRVEAFSQHAARTAELDQLSRSNASLREFALGLSHDLRAPLRTVATWTSELGECALDGPAAFCVERIHRGMRRVDQMLMDLLDYASLEAELPSARIELEDLVGEVVLDLEGAIREAEARVEVGPLPAVTGQPARLTQLFQNLIGNALKFGGRGVTVRVLCRRLADAVEVSIEDDGPGIDPEHHAKIFGVFSRVDPSDPRPGSGIGLAICRRIVERHGGRIRVESSPGQGAAFRFILPAPGSNGAEKIARESPGQDA